MSALEDQKCLKTKQLNQQGNTGNEKRERARKTEGRRRYHGTPNYGSKEYRGDGQAGRPESNAGEEDLDGRPAVPEAVELT